MANTLVPATLLPVIEGYKGKNFTPLQIFTFALMDKTWARTKEMRTNLNEKLCHKLFMNNEKEDGTEVAINGFSRDMIRAIKKVCEAVAASNLDGDSLEELEEDDEAFPGFRDKKSIQSVEATRKNNFKRLYLVNKLEDCEPKSVPRFELLTWCGGIGHPMTEYLCTKDDGEFYRETYDLTFKNGTPEYWVTSAEHQEAMNALFWRATQHCDTTLNILFSMFYLSIQEYTCQRVGGYGYLRELQKMELQPTNTRTKYDADLPFLKSLKLFKKSLNATVLGKSEFSLPDSFKTVLDGFNCENNAFLLNVRNMMREMFMKFQNRRKQVGSVDFVQGVMPAIYEFFKKKTEYNDLHDVMKAFRQHVLDSIDAYRRDNKIKDNGEHPNMAKKDGEDVKFGKGYFLDTLIQKILKEAALNFSHKSSQGLPWDVFEVHQAMRGGEKLIMQQEGCYIAFYFYIEALKLLSMNPLDIHKSHWKTSIGNIREQARHKKLIAKREEVVAAFKQHFDLLSETKKGDSGLKNILLPKDSGEFAKDVFLSVRGSPYDKAKEQDSIEKTDTEYFTDLRDIAPRGITSRIVYYAKLLVDVKYNDDEEQKSYWYKRLFPPMERSQWCITIPEETKKKSMRKRVRSNRSKFPPQLEACCVPQKEKSKQVMEEIMNTAMLLLKESEVFRKAILMEATYITGAHYEALKPLCDDICSSYAYVKKRGKVELIKKKRLRKEIAQGSRNMFSHGIIKKRKLEAFMEEEEEEMVVEGTGSGLDCCEL